MSGLSRDDIDEIIRLLDNSSFDELKLEIGDTRIELRRAGSGSFARRSEPPVDAGDTTTADAASQPAAAPAQRAQPAPTRPEPVPAVAGDGVDVPAPQLGIFYHAPRPGEPPFVSVGDRVEPDTVIGIIEVMKLMNTVAAGIAGVVTGIVAPNGEGVKQGDTLIRVKPDAGSHQGA